MTSTQKSPATKPIRQYYRNGDNHRDGADVSFADVIKYFGFKTAKIGNWVTKQEQQRAANLFFDAFCDLMDILQVPPSVISLRGTLSLGFGVGGSKYSKAHYNSANRTISLAKNAGGGALAHEWFHAFDHYVTLKMYPDASLKSFASECWLNERNSFKTHPLNEYLQAFFSLVFLDNTKRNPSRIMQTSISTDSKLKSFYYARPQEITARVFERLIQESSIKNSFLVSGTKQSQEATLGLYPTQDEVHLIRPSLFTYFSQLGQAIKN